MWRIIIAALAGYLFIGALVVPTDKLFAVMVPGFSELQPLPLYYFLISLVTDTVYSVAGGYVCAVIAKERKRHATYLLIAGGEAIGIAAQVKLAGTVPLWFSVGLLVAYPLAVWFGAKLRREPLAGMATSA